MLLHTKLPRVALGRIPVLAATLLAFSVVLRMPQIAAPGILGNKNCPTSP